MFGLFKKNDSETDTKPIAHQGEQFTAPGTEIHYHPDLIAQLKGDHQDLLNIYGEIKTAFNNNDYVTVSEKLNQFRTGLQGHLLSENVRLYIYLDHCLAGDETNSELIRDFRREMGDIGKTVMNFLKKYEAIGVDQDLAPSFARDFETLGKVLGERIQREEKVLYPLYLPSYK